MVFIVVLHLGTKIPERHRNDDGLRERQADLELIQIIVVGAQNVNRTALQMVVGPTLCNITDL